VAHARRSSHRAAAPDGEGMVTAMLVHWLRAAFLLALVANVCWLAFLAWANDHE